MLDRFKVVDQLMSDLVKFRSWLGQVVLLDNLPLLVQIDFENRKPLVPFKFNYSWLVEEQFKYLVLKNWRHYDSSSGDSAMNQSMENLKRDKVDIFTQKMRRILRMWKKV